MSKHIETPEIDLHSEYYEKHGMSYVTSDEMECEHTMAISVMAGLGRAYSWKSYCDVGAGSGRGILLLKNLVENANIIGIEPVKTLRSFAVKRGIPENQIIDGNAVQLPYKDCFFDCVYATGILHHICKPRLAIKEMWRIARHALVLFDLNNFGCGTISQRIISHLLRALDLWKTFQYLNNGFKPEKFRMGDGTHYSYSLFDDIGFISELGGKVHLLTTKPTLGNSFWDSQHISLIVFKNEVFSSGYL